MGLEGLLADDARAVVCYDARVVAFQPMITHKRCKSAATPLRIRPHRWGKICRNHSSVRQEGDAASYVHFLTHIQRRFYVIWKKVLA